MAAPTSQRLLHVFSSKAVFENKETDRCLVVTPLSSDGSSLAPGAGAAAAAAPAAAAAGGGGGAGGAAAGGAGAGQRTAAGSAAGGAGAGARSGTGAPGGGAEERKGGEVGEGKDGGAGGGAGDGGAGAPGRRCRNVSEQSRAEAFASEAPTQSIAFEAIFGIYDLLSGSYVALILDSDLVYEGLPMKVPTHPPSPVPIPPPIEIRKARSIIIVPLVHDGRHLTEEEQRDEDRYLELLHTALDAHQFYFSYRYDVTHTLQRLARMNAREMAQPIWARADPRFFWNRDVITDLMSCDAADQWVTPVMSAYVEARQGCSIDDARFTLLFISRRSRHRQGCRFTRRGIDDDGNVANFVETEQCLLFPDGRQTAHVQIRGSIPVFWMSPVHMKYAPQVHIGQDRLRSVLACQKHVEELSNFYGDRIEFINTVDMKKEQQQLGRAFQRVVEDIQPNVKAHLKYEWFDFHHECRKMRWHNLSKLIDRVGEDLDRMLFFERAAGGQVMQFQLGVFRTNCMDNLDRTNVVQSLFARRTIVHQLDIPMPENVLELPYKDFELVYKDVWANNADSMSLLYAGTGALKTDFTRTGRRTKRGMLQDGVNSCVRYYRNNFEDGGRQDALDLMLGRYKPDIHRPSPFVNRPDQETVGSYMTKIFVLFIAVFSILVLFGHPATLLQRHLVRALSITCGIVLFLLYRMVKKGTKQGERLVVEPLFLPEYKSRLASTGAHGKVAKAKLGGTVGAGAVPTAVGGGSAAKGSSSVRSDHEASMAPGTSGMRNRGTGGHR